MKKTLAVLGIAAFAFQNNIFGGKPHVKLTQEDLDKIEAALPDEGAENLTEKVDGLNQKIGELEQSELNVQEAITTAFEEHGLELTEGETAAEAIAKLSAKCTEYGTSTNTHSIPPTDGKDKQEGLENGFFDANAPHNQI